MATTSRFTDNVGVFNQGRDNTDRIVTNTFLQPAYSATIALSTNTSKTLVAPATLTGALTVTASVGTSTTAPYIGDVIEFQFVPDGTSRVVTFGTGFQSTGTLSVTTAKYATASFQFNGVAWIERARAVTA